MRTETLSLGLYVLSAGLLGLLGYELSTGYTLDWVGVPGVGPKSQPLEDYVKQVTGAEHKRAEGDRRWSYGQRYQAWWSLIATANFTGKLPPEPVPDKPEQAAPEKVETPQTPLKDILTVLVVLGGEGGIQIRYNDGVAVEPPPAPTMDGQPLQMVNLGAVYQVVRFDEGLYKPYQEIKPIRLTIDTETNTVGVVFSRPHFDPAKPDERVEETVFLGELDLSGEVITGVPGNIPGAGGTGAGGGDTQAIRQGTWEDPGRETRRVGDTWMVSLDDQDYLGNVDEVMTDLAVDDYYQEFDDPVNAGKKVRIQGVAVRKVSPQMRRFGVQEGEILVSVNGEKVTSRANAIATGKRQYNRGVRTYQLKFLTSTGREVVRTYQAPDKKGQ
ncbi:MAG: hypothetical protein R3F30_12055 [Planctomycetota bacterium]